MRPVLKTLFGLTAASVIALASTSSIGAQDAAKKQAPPKVNAPAAAHVIMTPDKVQWGPAPPSLPPGVQAALLDGDPGKAGLFVIRLKFPDGYRVPPHWHPTDEHVVVVAGTLMAAMGNKIDDAAMQALPTGSYVKMPRKMPHTVRAKGETIVQVTAMGPFEVTYVNPQDDPRKKTGH